MFYIIVIIISIYFAFKIYIRFKSKFWVLQPVYHLYDIHYMFYKPDIIMKKLPEINKYVNPISCKTSIYDPEITDISEYVELIQNHYYKNKNIKDNKYYPLIENISPYLVSYQHPSFISLYEKNGRIIGGMTTRHLICYFNKEVLNIYYVDWLCLSIDERKKGYSEEIIQTHEYKQRHMNKNIQISLFKREEKITGIVPLTLYETSFFDISNCKLIEYIKQFHEVNYDFFKCSILEIKDMKDIINSKFLCSIMPNIESINHLIQTNNYFIYGIRTKKSELIGMLFFKKTCMYINKDSECISLESSIFVDNSPPINIDKIVVNILLDLQKQNNKYSQLSIEGLSDNHHIYNIIKKINQCYDKYTVGYFFYNYIRQSIRPESLFILT